MEQEMDSTEEEVKQTSKTLLPWEAAHSLSADMVICIESCKKKFKTSLKTELK
jgi:predicted transcriptional regulator